MRLLYLTSVQSTLVRANGIGEWAAELNRLLTGPTAGHLVTEVQREKRELTERKSKGDWQYEAVTALHDCLTIVNPDAEPLGSRTTGRQWFIKFTEIRNKTRGHGAPTGEQCRQAARVLEKGIRTFAGEFSLFRRPWAHLKQTTSGKYHLTMLGGDNTPFQPLTSRREANLPDGVYLWLDGFMQATLLFGEAGSEDVLAPNGAFNGKRFEVRSLVTNDSKHIPAVDYLIPVTALPGSETEGLRELDVMGEVFSNLPPSPDEYIRRPELEEALVSKLREQARYPIVTLTGRGGVGKTSLALRVLHNVAGDGDYEAILWFSARDIDLLAHGPTSVRPQVVTIEDIADEYVRLVGRAEGKPVELLQGGLQRSPFDKPLLLVFDNFETVRKPTDLFRWIETYTYPPNKVLTALLDRCEHVARVLEPAC